jgi:hypothetical protein
MDGALLHPCFGIHKAPYSNVAVDSVLELGRAEGTVFVVVQYAMDSLSRETTLALEPGEAGWAIQQIDYVETTGYYWMMNAIIAQSK